MSSYLSRKYCLAMISDTAFSGKAEKLLGWKPQVSLQDGLKKMLSFMQEIIN